MKPNNPLQIFKAVYRYAKIPSGRRSVSEKPKAFVLGLSPWKTFIEDWLPDSEIYQRNRNLTAFEFFMSFAPWILADKSSTVYVWGYKHPAYLIPFCERFRVPYVRIEDGFIRSVALGADKAPPLSLAFDSPVLYFDATQPSRLETILETYDFAADTDLMERARNGIERLISSRLSKYNVSEDADIEAIYGPKDRKRVLVVGQVEGDIPLSRAARERSITTIWSERLLAKTPARRSFTNRTLRFSVGHEEVNPARTPCAALR